VVSHAPRAQAIGGRRLEGPALGAAAAAAAAVATGPLGAALRSEHSAVLHAAGIDVALHGVWAALADTLGTAATVFVPGVATALHAHYMEVAGAADAIAAACTDPATAARFRRSPGVRAVLHRFALPVYLKMRCARLRCVGDRRLLTGWAGEQAARMHAGGGRRVGTSRRAGRRPHTQWSAPPPSTSLSPTRTLYRLTRGHMQDGTRRPQQRLPSSWPAAPRRRCFWCRWAPSSSA
jgi:hypothetical protein